MEVTSYFDLFIMAIFSTPALSRRCATLSGLLSTMRRKQLRSAIRVASERFVFELGLSGSFEIKLFMENFPENNAKFIKL